MEPGAAVPLGRPIPSDGKSGCGSVVVEVIPSLPMNVLVRLGAGVFEVGDGATGVNVEWEGGVGNEVGPVVEPELSVGFTTPLPPLVEGLPPLFTVVVAVVMIVVVMYTLVIYVVGALLMVMVLPLPKRS